MIPRFDVARLSNQELKDAVSHLDSRIDETATVASSAHTKATEADSKATEAKDDARFAKYLNYGTITTGVLASAAFGLYKIVTWNSED